MPKSIHMMIVFGNLSWCTMVPKYGSFGYISKTSKRQNDHPKMSMGFKENVMHTKDRFMMTIVIHVEVEGGGSRPICQAAIG